MNIILITAILGFLCYEWYIVDKAVRPQPGVHFNALYYLKNNWFAIVGNLLGTALMYLAAPAVMMALHYLVKIKINDPQLVDMLSETILAPVTGGVIGLFGAMFVRYVQDKGKGWFSVKDEPEEHPQA